MIFEIYYLLNILSYVIQIVIAIESPKITKLLSYIVKIDTKLFYCLPDLTTNCYT
jgi:hypothetical protein